MRLFRGPAQPPAISRQRYTIVMTFILIGLILVIILSGLVFLKFYNFYPQSTYPVIRMYNLTHREERTVQNVLDDTRLLYLQYANEITFTKDLHDVCPYNDCAEVEGLLGFNQLPSRKIVILYSDDEWDMRTTLCHELLHSVVYAPTEDGLDGGLHEIVYDLGLRHPCFKSQPYPREH